MSPAEASESRSAVYAGYPSVEETDGAYMIGGLLVVPTGVAGIFAGLKAGVEVVIYVACPGGFTVDSLA